MTRRAHENLVDDADVRATAQHCPQEFHAAQVDGAVREGLEFFHRGPVAYGAERVVLRELGWQPIGGAAQICKEITVGIQGSISPSLSHNVSLCLEGGRFRLASVCGSIGICVLVDSVHVII